MPGSIQAPEKMGAEDAPMPLNNLPWGKELMAGVVNVLDEYDIPSLLWGDSVLAALDKPTALDSFYFVIPDEYLVCATNVLTLAGLSSCSIHSSKLRISRFLRCTHYDNENENVNEKGTGDGYRRLYLPKPPIHFSHPAGPSSCIGLFPHSSVYLPIGELNRWTIDRNDSRYQITTRIVDFQPPARIHMGSSLLISQPVRMARLPRLCEAYALLSFRHYGTTDMEYWLVMLAYMRKHLDGRGSGGLAGELVQGEIRDLYLSVGWRSRVVAAKAGKDKFFSRCVTG